MLKSLTINNIVLIEKETIDFSNGLCILSGETGSGKSILLDALGLTIGFRSSIKLIGQNEEKASASAIFDISQNSYCQKLLDENELTCEEDKNLVRIRRIIKEGNSKTFINDNLVGVNLLAKIGSSLVEIHGQHDQKGLLSSSSHLYILDEFAQNQQDLKTLDKIHKNLKEIDEKIADILNKKEAAIKEKDYLQYIIQELEDANLKIGEEDELMSKKETLIAKEKILNFINDLKQNLVEANSNLILGQRILIKNQNIIDNYLSEDDENFNKLSEDIDNQNIALDGAIENLEDKIREISSEENNIDEIEERLFYLRGLARKFNVTCDELFEVITDANEKLKLIENEEEVSLELKTERKEIFKKYQTLAQKISQKRQESGKILAKKVEEELKFLKMEGTKFKVEITKEKDESNHSSKGFDHVRFKASLNNNPFDDISKIASGGELSRFMLALKTALMDVKSTPTIIFDEIDTGIGGATANAVGDRLKTLSQTNQILVVTHQPQIAAKANLHFKISKSKINDKVKTKIETLQNEEKIKEVARMLSGEEISDEAIAAAKKLAGI